MSRDLLFSRVVGLMTKVHELEDSFKDIEDREVTKLQKELLLLIYLSCSRNLSSLSRCLNINLPNCSREVKKLTEAGYIRKERSTTDRRETQLLLTDRGLHYTEDWLNNIKTLFFNSRSEFTEEKISQIISAIDLLEAEIF